MGGELDLWPPAAGSCSPRCPLSWEGAVGATLKAQPQHGRGGPIRVFILGRRLEMPNKTARWGACAVGKV